MKIGIIGLGSVGSAVATAVHNTGLVNEIVLFDKDNLRAAAAAEDLGNAAMFGFNVKISALSDYRGFKDCSIVIIAAGANQKPGQSREDLVGTNASVMRDIIPKLIRNVDTKKVILIVVTNPLDVITMLVRKISGLPESRVIGTGTMLDSARFKMILANKFNISPESITAHVLGAHGTGGVVNWSSVTIGGLTLDEFSKQTKNILSAAARKTIEYRVKNAADEIIRGRGATWDGIAAATAQLVCAIINDENKILTVSIVDKNIAVSMPAIVGASGIIDVLQPKISLTEFAELQKSRANIKSVFASIV